VRGMEFVDESIMKAALDAMAREFTSDEWIAEIRRIAEREYVAELYKKSTTTPEPIRQTHADLAWHLGQPPFDQLVEKLRDKPATSIKGTPTRVAVWRKKGAADSGEGQAAREDEEPLPPGFGRASMVGSGLKLLELTLEDDTLSGVHDSLVQSVKTIQDRLQDLPTEPSDDGERSWVESVTDEGCALIEELLGVAFVGVQTFATGIRSQVIKLSEVCEREYGRALSFVNPWRLGKDGALSRTQEREEKRRRAESSGALLGLGSALMAGSEFTQMEVMDGVSNYWKHREEWDLVDWDDLSGAERKTAARVQVAGLRSSSTGNLRAAAKAFGLPTFRDLEVLREIARKWGWELHERARAEIETMRQTR
jgi:hypothetical protein